ncbi:hypothetical protein AJ78_06487 [Emergomyces pasteurianus Ep9510]|uniref:Uncharacterized protein n=1 Tax=Emergomyces pasteurianus Ep9510 TaxID=1447872 RepID=A0A1J9PAL5_9EURO|nr:hypothetical protein AJ78_06487 [Emergomyces pasteurianus Ep9510]
MKKREQLQLHVQGSTSHFARFGESERSKIYVARGCSPIANVTDAGYPVADLSGQDQLVAAKSFALPADEWLADYTSVST